MKINQNERIENKDFFFQKTSKQQFEQGRSVYFFLVQDHAIHCCQSSSQILRHLAPFVLLFYPLHMWLAYPGPSWPLQHHPSCLHSSRKEEKKGEGNGLFLKNISWKFPILPLFSFSWPDLSHIATQPQERLTKCFLYFQQPHATGVFFIEKKQKSGYWQITVGGEKRPL